MKVTIGCVTTVSPHPLNEELNTKMDIVSIDDNTNVATRVDGQPRYKVGDYVATIPENMILPEWLLKHLDLWDATKEKGFLAGSKGNRTKARNIKGVVSDVALLRIDWRSEGNILVDDGPYVKQNIAISIPETDRNAVFTKISAQDLSINPEGIDIAPMLDVKAYEP